MYNTPCLLERDFNDDRNYLSSSAQFWQPRINIFCPKVYKKIHKLVELHSAGGCWTALFRQAMIAFILNITQNNGIKTIC